MKIRIKINTLLKGHEPGSVITLEADANGTPKGRENLFWRRRIRDAKYDNCVEVLLENDEEEINFGGDQ